jgi:hypothetical protein
VIEFFGNYDTGEFYDEMFAAPGEARPHYERLLQRFTELTKDEFDRKRELAALYAGEVSGNKMLISITNLGSQTTASYTLTFRDSGTLHRCE